MTCTFRPSCMQLGYWIVCNLSGKNQVLLDGVRGWISYQRLWKFSRRQKVVLFPWRVNMIWVLLILMGNIYHWFCWVIKMKICCNLELDLKLFGFIPFLRNISTFTTAIGVTQCYQGVSFLGAIEMYSFVFYIVWSSVHICCTLPSFCRHFS